MASTNIKRVAHKLDRALEKDIASTSVDVLVLGPSLDGSQLGAGARLRKAILERCEDFGAAAMGEHKELMRVARKRLGKDHDLCSYERYLAPFFDLIVIIPSSPGSFVELGLFALERDLWQKTLVLFDREYKACKSYIVKGPRRAFVKGRAVVRNVDYEATERVWRIVQGRIEDIRVFKLGEKQDVL